MKQGSSNSARSRSQLDLDLLLEEIEVAVPFCSSSKQTFVRVALGDSVQAIPIHSPAFRNWLIDKFDRRTGRSPNPALLRRVIQFLENRAFHDLDHLHPVFHRIARAAQDGVEHVVLDLAHETGKAIDITPAGWTVTAEAPGLFMHQRASLPLPEPDPAAPPLPLTALRSLLNPATDLDFHRILCWLAAAMQPTGPYPILLIQGAPGSGKSTAARMLHTLIDPSTAPLSELPVTQHRLLEHAYHNRVLAFDDVGHLGPRLSSTFSQIATGAGFTLREVRENRAPVQSTVQRPIILTAGDGFTPLPEIAGLALTVHTAPLTPETRRTEADLWNRFNALHPNLLAALCTAVSTALRPETHPPNDAMTQNLPHCADAFVWTCRTAILPLADVRAAFTPDPDPFVQSLTTFMETRPEWTGTAAELLDQLPAAAAPNARAISVNLRHAIPLLQSAGILVSFSRTARSRLITLQRPPSPAKSLPSCPGGDAVRFALTKSLPPPYDFLMDSPPD